MEEENEEDVKVDEEVSEELEEEEDDFVDTESTDSTIVNRFALGKPSTRENWRPDVSHLQDAVVALEDGTLIFVPEHGEKVVAERFATILTNKPWLDTRTLVVLHAEDGENRIELWDEEYQRRISLDFVSAHETGAYVFKIAPLKGPLSRPGNQKKLKIRKRRRVVTEE